MSKANSALEGGRIGNKLPYFQWIKVGMASMQALLGRRPTGRCIVLRELLYSHGGIGTGDAAGTLPD
jgi:hypothetical protein